MRAVLCSGLKEIIVQIRGIRLLFNHLQDDVSVPDDEGQDNEVMQRRVSPEEIKIPHLHTV